MRSSHRIAWAVLASLSLHALVLGWLLWRRGAPDAKAPRAVPAPLVVEIVESAPLSERVKAAQEHQRSPVTERARPEKIASPAQPSVTVYGEGSGIQGHAANAPPALDGPRRLSTLVPAPKVSSPIPATPTDGADRRGRTVLNDGSGPSAQAVAGMNALEAKKRIDDWLADDFATVRVANGLVDPYFAEVRNALEKGASNAPREAWPGSSLAQNLVDQWARGAKRYGASGNPYAGPKGPPVAMPEGLSPMARAIERDAEMRELADRFSRAATLRDFANGDFAEGLVAIVEIRQTSDGKLLEAKLVGRSGNRHFDEYVVSTAPQSIAALPPVSMGLSDSRPEGIRSAWAFHGALTYKKKLREFDLKKSGDVAYLAVVGYMSLITGNFDEMSGDVDVVDLRNPKFTCRVKLLRVY